MDHFPLSHFQLSHSSSTRSSSMASSAFSDLRRSAEALERSLEAKVPKHGQCTSRICASLDLSLSSPPLDLEAAGSSAAGPDEADEASLSAEIAALLSDLSAVTRSMAEQARSLPPGGAAALLLKRYREIHADYSSDFKRSCATLLAKRNSHELMAGAANTNDGGGGDEATAHLLREREALSSSVASSASVISQAGEIFGELRAQRAGLTSSRSRVGQMASNVPGINGIIDGIRRRKQRDNVILGCVLAGCILFTLWYWVG